MPPWSQFGRRGTNAQAARANAPLVNVPRTAAVHDEPALADFQQSVRAEWRNHRRSRPAVWKRHPGLTALAAMTVIFVLLSVVPLHLSSMVIRWTRAALGIGGLFGLGSKRLFGKRPEQ